MFPQILDRVTGALGDRFTRAYLLPALAFVSLSGVVTWLGSGRALAELSDRWDKAGVSGQVALSSGLIGIGLLLGLFLSANALAITRIYEGYWGPPSWLRKLGCRYHCERFDDIEVPMRFELYPTLSNDLMPTALGNALKAGEAYSGNRYGAESTIVWSRLYGLLPDELRAEMSAARSRMDASLVIAVLATTFAVVHALILPLLESSTWTLYGVSVTSGIVIGWFGYLAAVSAAVTFSELVKASFDLHRLKLLKDLGFETPRSEAEERRLWGGLEEGWYRGGAVPRPKG